MHMPEGRGFHSIWSDLGQSSFSPRFIDAGGPRTRILTAVSRHKPLLPVIDSTGLYAEGCVRPMQAHGDLLLFVAVTRACTGWTNRANIPHNILSITDEST